MSVIQMAREMGVRTINVVRERYSLSMQIWVRLVIPLGSGFAEKITLEETHSCDECLRIAHGSSFASAFFTRAHATS